MSFVSRVAVLAGVAGIAMAPSAWAQMAQERVDLAVVDQIRQEGLERSQLDALAQHLVDVIGPRLTGSPAMRRANDWTADRFRDWGLTNVVVEPWGFFGRGWERVSYGGRILAPFVQPLHAQPVAWTGSTRGVVEARVVIVQADSAADLAPYRGELAGAAVVVQSPPAIEPEFEPASRRTSLETLLAAPEPRPEAQNEFLRQRQRFQERRRFRSELEEFLRAERVAVILTPSSRPYGILRGGGNQAGRDTALAEPLPELVISQEQYGQMHRNVSHGVPVTIEVEVENRFYADDLLAYNTLADLPGSDKADELVLLGAHLDSWHLGTGATDNAAGSLVMMEAMRILRAIGARPRRTIRIGLWSGEEQGLLGSAGWLSAHPELHAKISAYVNVDNGTGRIRGVWDQMNDAAIPVFEQILWPFRDLGVVAVRHGNTGGTDHLSFDRVGIPGFNFIQDPIEYSTRTHHTFVDTYDHLVLDDLRQAAVVVAATVYHLAMRDDLVPRKVQQASSR